MIGTSNSQSLPIQKVYRLSISKTYASNSAQEYTTIKQITLEKGLYLITSRFYSNSDVLNLYRLDIIVNGNTAIYRTYARSGQGCNANRLINCGNDNNKIGFATYNYVTSAHTWGADIVIVRLGDPVPEITL